MPMSMSSKNFWRELRGDFEGELKLHLGAEILDSEDPRSREDHSAGLQPLSDILLRHPQHDNESGGPKMREKTCLTVSLVLL